MASETRAQTIKQDQQKIQKEAAMTIAMYTNTNDSSLNHSNTQRVLKGMPMTRQHHNTQGRERVVGGTGIKG